MIEITTERCEVTLSHQAITVLFGPSGVGKSTLLKQLAGHLDLQGKLVFNGEPITTDKHFVKPEKRNFCYLSQRLNLIRTLTVAENLKLAAKFSATNEPDNLLEEMIEMVEIQDLLSRSTKHLSGGEYQLVSYCMAMISASRWLLFDEPFSAVDKQRLHRVLTRFKRWHQNNPVAVLYVTHDVHEMAFIADDVLHMSGSKSAQRKSYQELIQAVDSDFIATYANENLLETQWIRSEDGIQLLHLKDEPEQLIWALGDKPDQPIQWLSIPIADISISRDKLVDSSILNQLPARVAAIGKVREGICYISLDVGQQSFSVRITEKSRRELSLGLGEQCIVCFKAPKLIVG